MNILEWMLYLEEPGGTTRGAPLYHHRMVDWGRKGAGLRRIDSPNTTSGTELVSFGGGGGEAGGAANNNINV